MAEKLIWQQCYFMSHSNIHMKLRIGIGSQPYVAFSLPFSFETFQKFSLPTLGMSFIK